MYTIEENWESCVETAAAKNPEEMVKLCLKYLAKRHQGHPLWSVVSHIFGHGSGVSTAIVKRFGLDPCTGEELTELDVEKTPSKWDGEWS